MNVKAQKKFFRHFLSPTERGAGPRGNRSGTRRNMAAPAQMAEELGKAMGHFLEEVAG